MKVEVRAQGLPAASLLRERVRQRMHVALGRFQDSVEAVSVRLGDINGPRGGADKLCRIVVSLKNSSLIVVEGLGDDIAKVVDNVADRVHQSVSRQLGRVKRAARRQHRAFDDPGQMPELA